jgi:N-sulfoglucosamine sulfohydrolase
MITGCYPWSIGIHHMRSTLLHPPKCFTNELRAAGYHVSWPTKLDFNFEPPDDWVDSREPWISQAAPNQPFLVYENFGTTHESSMWRDAEAHYDLAVQHLEEGQVHSPAAAPVPAYLPDTPAMRQQLVKYYDSLTTIDKLIGTRLQWLEEQGLARNTLVIFLSDHGRGLPREKRWCYGAGLHVPLIIRWPEDSTHGRVCDDLISWVDIAPTILSAAGVDIPDHYQGQAFLGEHKAPHRQYVFAGRDRMDEVFDRVRVARDRRWHYIRNDFPGLPWAQRQSYMEQQPIMPVMREMHAQGDLHGPEASFFQRTKPAHELYDALNDPAMLHNLAQDPRHRDVIVRLSGALDAFRADYGDLGETTEETLVHQGLVADRLTAREGSYTSRETAGYRERLASLPPQQQIGPNPVPVTLREATEFARAGNREAH